MFDNILKDNTFCLKTLMCVKETINGNLNLIFIAIN